MVASTKVANCLALGGGTLIFIIVAAITVYMTSEYNKGPTNISIKQTEAQSFYEDIVY